jgi:hypothetical protein
MTQVLWVIGNELVLLLGGAVYRSACFWDISLGR